MRRASAKRRCGLGSELRRCVVLHDAGVARERETGEPIDDRRVLSQRESDVERGRAVASLDDGGVQREARPENDAWWRITGRAPSEQEREGVDHG